MMPYTTSQIAAFDEKERWETASSSVITVIGDDTGSQAQ